MSELYIKQSFHKDGKLCSEEHRLNGNLHNENGPAYCMWWKNGQIWYEGYWFNGKEYNKITINIMKFFHHTKKKIKTFLQSCFNNIVK